MREIKYIVLHCTGGNQNTTIASLENSWKRLGWKNKGYHFVVLASGAVQNITPVDQIANGVAGYNRHSIHISYMGGIDKAGKPIDNRTVEQRNSLRKLVKEMKTKFPLAKVCGHRDFSPDKDKDGVIESFEWIKVCPCFDAGKEYAGI